jgi:uncharacterized protein (TIGR02145 family)
LIEKEIKYQKLQLIEMRMRSKKKFTVLLCLILGVTLTNSCKKDPVLATLNTTSVTGITVTSAISGGNITSAGNADITARGVCYGTAEKPAISGTHTSDGTGAGSFTTDLINLTPNTLYYVRAFATNKAGTAYGAELSFTTTAIVVATLTTTDVTSVGLTTAVSGGNITADGGGAITAKGVCFSTTASPTIANSVTADGTGTGIFTSSLAGLLPATTYHLRAYATNTAGTAYGNEVSFTTNPIVVPTLTTAAITSINLTSAVSGGNISNDGGGAITARGVCWSTTANPTTAGSKTTDATGTGSFISNISGLLPGTAYHVRAYAVNSAGTAYGNDLVFTSSPVSVPTLTTAIPASIALTTAVSGGNITSNGGGTVTVSGICWATTTAPTTANSKTTDGTLTGVFTSNLTGLSPATTYYVRAYATNSAGTAYGNEVSFTTGQIVVPTLTTAAITSILQTTAVSGGNITDNGGGAVTSRGICWSLTASPTTSNFTVIVGNGSGVFSGNLTGLTPGTVYYVRAYAVNSAGTAYGNELSFTTNPITVPTLTTATVSSITLTSAVSGGTISSNGGGTITVSGICWATTASPTTANSKTTDGTLSGSFVSNLTGLIPGTTFHVRAYATNSAGTAYGNDISFTTISVVVPTVITSAATSIDLTTATSGGNVTSDGGAALTAKGVCWSTSTNPTIALPTKTNDGTTTGSFTSSLTGLSHGTTYYIRAYATNSAGTGYGTQTSFNTSIEDYEHNKYKTVAIGTQIWMAEDLKSILLNDGTPILNITNNAAWALDSVAKTPAYCWYNNDPAMKNTYGALYNWYVLNTGKLCPSGWHGPSEDEFTTLELYLGMVIPDPNYHWRGTNQGTQMKTITGWNAGVGTNTSGFSALPGGYRYGGTGTYNDLGNLTYWWTTTEEGATPSDYAWYRRLDGNQTGVYRANTHKWGAKFVRCIKN